MGTQIQNSLPWTLKGMLARIMAALLLVLLALPVLYCPSYIMGYWECTLCSGMALPSSQL